MQWPFHTYNYKTYSGRDSYKYISRLLKGSSKVYIISPYIDLYYAKVLKRLSANKKIYIISSSMDDEAKKILTKRHLISPLFYSAVLLLLLAALLALLGNVEIAFAFTTFAFVLSVGTAIAFKFSKPKNIMLKVPGDFVHAKLYIGGSMAIQGSANLTYKGMHSNVEHIEVVYDKQAVKRLAEEFWRIWSKY